jgi:hypothetical protein
MQGEEGFLDIGNSYVNFIIHHFTTFEKSNAQGTFHSIIKQGVFSYHSICRWCRSLTSGT